MQIAKVVPKVKTRGMGIFDYAISPEILPQIQLGILVEVPFHGRKIEGIVVDIKKSSKILKLKKIIKVVDPLPVIDDNHLKLSQWMSEYYFVSLGQTLFENIVPPAIRKINKNDYSILNRSTFYARAEKVLPKYFLVQGDFSFRLKIYQKAIEHSLAKNKSVIILVPDISLIKYFKFIIKPIILHATLSKTERWQAWDKIRSNPKQIIIGSQSALFAPVQNLGLIIIDQEESETYKNDRSPRFHVVTVANKLIELFGGNLIIGSTCPRIETYFNAIDSDYQMLIKKPKVKTKITIVDMNFQKSILSHPLQESIRATLDENKKVLLILNRKGEGTKFTCTDCGWVALCNKCGLPLVPQKTGLNCHNCEKQSPYPEFCQKCHGIHMKPFGMGTKRLAKIVQEIFNQNKIILIDKENPIPTNEKKWDIAIATSFALKLNLPKIALVAIIDLDQSLNLPEYLAYEKTFQCYYKFLKIGERGIVQTHLPDNPIISALAQLDYEKFYQEEIVKRRKFGFPPFTHLTRLLYSNTDQELGQKESQKIFDLIRSSDKDIQIYGPSEPFVNKIRGRFRFQIIIKTKAVDQNLKKLLTNLGTNWVIDTDPVDLL